MEVFVDFGLFELFAAAGLAVLARKIYTTRWLASACLILSLIAPVVLLFLADKELLRWLAAFCLATALINTSLIFLLIRRWDMSTLLEKRTSSPKLSGTEHSHIDDAGP
jgi:Kef-type K+ transport system membrane component KefB